MICSSNIYSVFTSRVFQIVLDVPRCMLSKGSDAAEGSGKRPQGRPKGRGKGGGKMSPPSLVPSSPYKLPSAHSSSEEEVQVEEEV